MSTYDRVFGNIGKINTFGHAYVNSVNNKALDAAKIDICCMLKEAFAKADEKRKG